MRAFVLLFILLLLVGCASEAPSFTIEQPEPPTEEELLLAQLNNSRLMVLKDKELRIPEGQKAVTMMAFKNANGGTKTFRIEICEYCHFNDTEITLEQGNATVVYFEVEDVPGVKTLVIRDDDNAFYTKATFTVTD